MERAEGTSGYLTHIPVRSYLEADILSKESTWNILGYVKTAGATGAAADEIAKSLSLPASVVYSTLKDLRRLEFISILPRTMKRTKERKKRYLCERTTWGKYRIDGRFMSAIAYEGVIRSLTDKLKAPILSVFSDLFEEFRANGRLRPYLPEAADGRICPICRRNHDATEFIYALILAALDPFITESKDFRRLLIEKGYAR